MLILCLITAEIRVKIFAVNSDLLQPDGSLQRPIILGEAFVCGPPFAGAGRQPTVSTDCWSYRYQQIECAVRKQVSHLGTKQELRGDHKPIKLLDL